MRKDRGTSAFREGKRYFGSQLPNFFGASYTDTVDFFIAKPCVTVSSEKKPQQSGKSANRTPSYRNGYNEICSNLFKFEKIGTNRFPQ